MDASRSIAWLIAATALLAGCAVSTSTGPTGGAPAPRSDSGSASPGRTASLDADQAARLKRIMVPLIGAMDHSRQLNQVKIGLIDDPQINAANAGNGEFFVTRGLLEKANDEQLTAILAHEVAHEDLGHVAKAQALGTGLTIGMIVLDQIFPGSGNLTPIAGTLVARAYSRKEEYAADEHGVELLERTGQPKEIMIRTLAWLMQTSGNDTSGFFATHPATGDRIDALRNVSAL
jgi:Zn-dependent protease with chaperone function